MKVLLRFHAHANFKNNIQNYLLLLLGVGWISDLCNVQGNGFMSGKLIDIITDIR